VPVSDRGAGGDGPVVALDAAGTATIAWRSHDELSERIMAARYAPGGPTSRAIEVDPLYPDESFVRLDIAANGPGDVMLGWNRWSASAGESVVAAFRPATGHWRSPRLLTRRNLRTPHVGIARNGDATLLWTAWDQMQARTRIN
jgi:hypothetical protein